MAKILIVEDDTTIQKIVFDKLNSWGMECVLANDFKDVTNQFLKDDYKLVLLDITLPYFNGFYWCKEIRKKSNVPIIFISAAESEINQIMAMDIGADDFIIKPFDLNVLVAKVNALLRRSYQYTGNILYKFNEYLFDFSNSTIERNNEKLLLSPNECRILKILFEEKNQVVLRIEIIEKLWASEKFIDENTLDVNIARLRKKLRSFGLNNLIKTVKNKGYLVMGVEFA